MRILIDRKRQKEQKAGRLCRLLPAAVPQSTSARSPHLLHLLRLSHSSHPLFHHHFFLSLAQTCLLPFPVALQRARTRALPGRRWFALFIPVNLPSYKLVGWGCPQVPTSWFIYEYNCDVTSVQCPKLRCCMPSHPQLHQLSWILCSWSWLVTASPDAPYPWRKDIIILDELHSSARVKAMSFAFHPAARKAWQFMYVLDSTDTLKP